VNGSSTQALPRTAPPGALGQIILNEARLAWRVPGGLVAGIGVPVVLLVIFGELPHFQQHLAIYGGDTEFEVYVPTLIVFSITMLALWGIPSQLVSYRELGILRRLSTTPAPPLWLLAAQVVVQLFTTVVGIVLMIVLSVTVFSAAAPRNYGGLILSIALCIAGLFGIGLSIAALARTSGAAGILGRVAFFPLMFFAGLWDPLANMPQWVQDIGDYTPVGAAVEALQDSAQGTFPPFTPLLTLVGYALVFIIIAWRFFRWE
jgi:ABC-2 type transport system permease protein